MFWPFTVWINCSNDLKHFANLAFSLKFQKFFSITKTIFFFRRSDQFCYKIQFFTSPQHFPFFRRHWQLFHQLACTYVPTYFSKKYWNYGMKKKISASFKCTYMFKKYYYETKKSNKWEIRKIILWLFLHVSKSQ